MRRANGRPPGAADLPGMPHVAGLRAMAALDRTGKLDRFW